MRILVGLAVLDNHICYVILTYKETNLSPLQFTNLSHLQLRLLSDAFNLLIVQGSALNIATLGAT